MDFSFVFSGRPWTCKFMPKSHEYLKHAHGCTDFETSTLFINEALEPHYRLVTVWHELTHVFLEPWNATDKSKMHQELACDLVGSGMAQLLFQRSALPDWLFQSVILPKARQRRSPKKA